MIDSGNDRRRTWIALAGAAAVSVLASIVLITSAGSSATFSEHPRAKRIALALQRGDVVIRYQRCGDDDLIPYVDAWEVVTSDELHEWEVHAQFWGPDEASWMTGRHVVGEEGSSEPTAEPFEGSLPPADEVRMNVHVYSASLENRWHVRVNEVPMRALPDASISPREVMSAEGATMTEDRWREQAKNAC